MFRDDDGNHGLLYNNVFPEFFKNQVYIEPGSFRLPEEIEKHASHLISLESKPIVNETKVRLLTDIHDLSTANFGAPIRLQKTRYFYDRVTNGLAPKRIRSRSESILGHEFMVGSDDLRQLKESDLSNQLGGATMLVTADQKLVYVEQGSESAENPSTFAPAGSGSFDWARLVAFKRARPSGIFADFARAEIERELCEEVGVDCNIRHKTFLVGYGRLLYRNGKPDMFALTVTDQLFSDLRVRFQEWKFIWWELRSKDVDSLTSDGVKSSLQRLLYDHESESRGSSGLSFSVPLIMNLKAAISFLAKEENSEIIDKFYRNQIPICNLHAASASRS